jgi:hypothetical protein
MPVYSGRKQDPAWDVIKKQNDGKNGKMVLRKSCVDFIKKKDNEF